MKETEGQPSAEIEIKPVSWTDGKVNKYQGIATYGRLRITGDPKPSMKKALESLVSEIYDWTVAVIPMYRNARNYDIKGEEKKGLRRA